MQSDGQDLITIKNLLNQLLNRQDIQNDEDVYEAGLTSIMVLPLLSGMEDAFALSIPDAEFLDARTPSALAQMVSRLRASASST